MLIGYAMPPVTGLALDGATWLTVDGGAACVDGKPARKARIDGTPVVTLTFDAAFTPRIIAVLGLSGVAVGSAITATTGAGGALGGNAGTATAVRFADGSIGAWIVTGGTVVTNTVRISIGATGTIDIGELVAMPAVEIRIDAGWTQGRVDPSVFSSGRGSQVNTVAVTDYRVLGCTFSPDPAGEAPVRFGGLANGMDWESLANALSGGARCAVIPRWADNARIQATAMYGIASEIGETQHLRGPFWSKAMRFREIPAG